MSDRDTALVRGLKVLTRIAESGETTAKQLADDVGLPLSTTYRYLKTLRDFELVEEFDGRYLPSSRLSSWSGHGNSRSHLLEVGHPFLRRLSARTGRTSVLAVREGRNAVCLRQFAPDEDADIAFRTYEVLPLDRGAGQRVLLAHAPPQIIAEVAAESTEPRERLLDVLRLIRQEGFAQSRSQLRDGATALAMPVIVRGEVLCSLTLAGHTERFGAKTVRTLTPVLAEAVEQLRAELEESC
ncbi:IclR family transcriptional regulator [Brevibacterium sanguinis]|uniref:IclR family transcriptional regulator n=2 Tax=Brevibacterium TaxID=1696 RepID=A0A366IHA1_9MICO|nr:MULTISPECIES: IclR family transcriptional regulator [Brevibacterium]RBP64969.1 IclR family transcriptional regulator [Brevibacterium sanguinis]RBP71232.1 IclR family transcriptional regulator [Brevibacterium celere]